MLAAISRISVVRGVAPRPAVALIRLMRTKTNTADTTSPPIDDLSFEEYGISHLDEKDLVTLHQAGWSLRPPPEESEPESFLNKDMTKDSPPIANEQKQEPTYYAFKGFGARFGQRNLDVDPTKIHLYKHAFDENEWNPSSIDAEERHPVPGAKPLQETKREMSTMSTRSDSAPQGPYYKKLGYRRHSLH